MCIRDRSREELNNTLNFFIRQSQLTYYHKEIIEIRNGNLSKSSKIISLDPFIDDLGLLRVGVRLQHSDLPYDIKHQIILHPKAYLTRLIIVGEHSRLLQAGVQLTHSSVRQRHWIVNGKIVIGSVIRKCIKCFRFRTHKQTQQLGQLPSSRVVLTLSLIHI